MVKIQRTSELILKDGEKAKRYDLSKMFNEIIHIYKNNRYEYHNEERDEVITNMEQFFTITELKPLNYN